MSPVSQWQILEMPGLFNTNYKEMKYLQKLVLSVLVFLSSLMISAQNSNKMDAKKAELCFEIKSLLGEGAFWDHQEQRLYWVDIEGKKLHLFDPTEKKNISFDMPSRIGTVVPIDKKEAVVALEDGIFTVSIKDGTLTRLSDVESTMDYNRFNDGKCDPNGNLWVGSMHLAQSEPKANLYKVNGLGDASVMLDSVTISNGIVWTKDQKTMYYIDTPTGQIRAFDFDVKNSTISNERVAVIIPESVGFGDGMTIDAEDKLWVGLWNGNAVARFDPVSGKLMEKIAVPAHNVTSCSFGGPNFETLYITTSSLDMTEEEKKAFPLAGSLFKVNPGVKGVAGNYFAK